MLFNCLDVGIDNVENEILKMFWEVDICCTCWSGFLFCYFNTYLLSNWSYGIEKIPINLGVKMSKAIYWYTYTDIRNNLFFLDGTFSTFNKLSWRVPLEKNKTISDELSCLTDFYSLFLYCILLHHCLKLGGGFCVSNLCPKSGACSLVVPRPCW